MITKEDMEALKSYEYYFRTAISSNYCRNFGSKQYEALNTIYERITGHKYAGNWGCPHCAVRFIQTLGNLYFAELDRQENAKSADNNQQVQKELEPENVTASEPKKKTTRKKKAATNNESNTE